MTCIGRKCTSGVPRGRPNKKPGYDREKEIQDLIDKAVELFQIPYDDRCERPTDAPSIRFVAEQMNSTHIRVRKLLITAGYYSTALSRKVQGLSDQGYSIQEIMDETGLNKASVMTYLPYSKGAYGLNDPTLLAERSQRLRQRKQACKTLACHLDDMECCGHLWDAIREFEDYPFRKDKEIIKYKIDCEKLMFTCGTRITKEEVVNAFRRARDSMNRQGYVSGCECLGCDGAEKLMTVFLRIGACKEKV